MTIIFVFIVLIIIVLALLFSSSHSSADIKEGFYEFLVPTSLTIPDMFKLSDESMSNIFEKETHIRTPKQGICK